jgi:hypothetical protein
MSKLSAAMVACLRDANKWHLNNVRAGWEAESGTVHATGTVRALVKRGLLRVENYTSAGVTVTGRMMLARHDAALKRVEVA